MNESQFDAISRKLDILVRLTALSYTADKKQQERIMMMSAAGFQPKEIAELLGTTANNVRVALSTMRKKKKG